MSTILPFGNNTIAVYAYEPFSYTISNPNAGLYTIQTPSNTPGLGIVPSPFIVQNDNTDYVFSSTGPSNTLSAGTTESFYLPLTNGVAPVATSSNTVNIYPGRFLDPSGNSLLNTSYTFNARQPITSVGLVAPFALSMPVSSPTLPPGLVFTSNVSNRYDITGTPLVTVPQSNYLIIGKDTTGSKIITTTIKILVTGEQILLNLSGSPIISMTLGNAITPRVVTASFPPYPSVPTNLRYTIPGLPDGLYLADSSGTQTPLPYSFVPTDPSSTIMIKGTPSSNAAYAFLNAGITSTTVNLTATRISLPAISNTTAFTFAFNETVLFDQTTPTALTVYNGVLLDPSANYFHAQTYFGSSAISNITALSLPNGLSLNFVPSSARAYLTGTPTTNGSNAYAIHAVNSNGFARDFSTTISVVDDYVTFVNPTPAIDTSYNFIVSRPLSNAKVGYYPTPIQFVAVAASGLPITYTAPSLSGTGLTIGSNTGLVGGFPNAVTSLTNLIVTATATASAATQNQQVKFAVLNEVFTLSNVAASNFVFTQNIPITSFQITATTLSERPVNGFSATGFPTGVTISGNGLVSGTPTSSASGTVTIFPTTGYVTGSNSYAFTVTPDSILFTTPQLTYSYPAGANVSIPVTAISYSGRAVSNYSTSDLIYGPTINSVTGLISGALSDSIPPHVLLPLNAVFAVYGTVGSLTGTLGCGITTSNPILYRSFLTVNPSGDGNVSTGIWTSDNLTLSNAWSNLVPIPPSEGSISDFQIKNDTIYSNVYIAAINGPNKHFTRSVYGTIFENVTHITGANSPTITSLTNRTGTSDWWAVGNEGSDTSRSAIYTSSDDGATWSFGNAIIVGSSYIRTRDYPSGGTTGYYLPAGANIRYSSNVLMVGGMMGTATSMARSTDFGSTWTSVTGAFQGELAYYCLDNSSTWVATGSDYTTVAGPPAPIFPATEPPSVPTIRYSTDQGATWLPATGDFNTFGYDIVYASNTWVATGVDAVPPGSFMTTMKYSTDGQTWSNVTPPTGSPPTPTCPQPPIGPGPVMYDGSNWNVFFNLFDNGRNKYVTYLYYTSNITAGSPTWTPSSLGFSFPPQTTGRLSMSVFKGHAVPTGETNPIVSTFIMGTLLGPLFTSPLQHVYYPFQYIPIAPIQLSAVLNPNNPDPPDTSNIYFFVIASTLPPGLSFDKNTNTIYGTPAQIGTFSTNVYAKNNSGYSLLVLTFVVTVPRIVRQQDGAGAYTSLVRQYTQVNAAQNARDNRVFPAIDSTLGEFMAPPAPDVVTQTIDPCCKDPK
jgi:hypothetical protein